TAGSAPGSRMGGGPELTRRKVDADLARAPRPVVAAHDPPAEPAVVLAQGEVGERLLAERAGGHRRVVLPRDDRLLDLLAGAAQRVDRRPQRRGRPRGYGGRRRGGTEALDAAGDSGEQTGELRATVSKRYPGGTADGHL